MALDKDKLSEFLCEERTLLAKERTSLAYIRTGVAFIAVGLGAMKVFEMQGIVLYLGTAMVFAGIGLILYHAMWDRRYVHRLKKFEEKIHKLVEEDQVTNKSMNKEKQNLDFEIIREEVKP